MLGIMAREVSQKLGKDVRVVATTHSPYIVLGGLARGALAKPAQSQIGKATQLVVQGER
jgi:hypothetical protein